MASIISHQMSAHGLDVRVTSYGASLQDLRLTGQSLPLVLGFEDAAAYASHSAHMGASAGRYANRIADGSFAISGHIYHLDKNEAGKHTLHGGQKGCGTALWDLTKCGPDFATFTLTEPDGHMGFPGQVSLSCTYQIMATNKLAITYQGTTTKPTHINLAHHSYFKLDDRPDVCDHELQILAERYLPVSQDNLPIGGPRSVTSTRFDFRKMRPIGDDLFDHNFCLDQPGQTRQVARLYSPHSNIEMTMISDQPGLQFYNAAHLNENGTTHHKRAYHRCDAVCLEPQKWPNSPNRPDFPSSLIMPQERYEQRILLQFIQHKDKLS